MRTMPEGRMAPRILMRGRPLQRQVPQGAPGSHTWDTASGTSPTWPPALNSMDCTLYNMLDKDNIPARSIKSIPLSNPKQWASQGRCRKEPAPPSTSGFLYPDAIECRTFPRTSQTTAPAPFNTSYGCPQLGCPGCPGRFLVRLVSWCRRHQPPSLGAPC